MSLGSRVLLITLLPSVSRLSNNVGSYHLLIKSTVLMRNRLRSSGQSSWLQIRRPGFDSRHYQIFWGGGAERKIVVGLERGSLSLVSATEELLDRKVAAPV
jgi:hypothetical protein